MLVPMYFLIGIWGGPRKLYAAIKFFLYTLVGSVLMLVGILALYFYNSTDWRRSACPASATRRPSTSPSCSRSRRRSQADLQIWIFLAFFVGFAIKVPMFPFHTWLPDAHVEAPTAGSVILAGVLLKMGTYGFLRFSLPLLPDATAQGGAAGWSALAIIGIIYGALVAMAQKDMKKLVAYSSVSPPRASSCSACSPSTRTGCRGGDAADDQPRRCRPAACSCSSASSTSAVTPA